MEPFGRQRRWSAVGLGAAGLLIAACSDNASHQPSAETDGVVAATPVGAGDRSSERDLPDNVTSDALSAEAQAAQEQLLAANEEKSDAAATEADIRNQLNERVLNAFKLAVADLRRAGVQFDKAEYALNTLNVSRRRQGVFELNTKYQAPDDSVRVVGDDLTSDPFAVAYLSGTHYPQTFGATVPQKVLAVDGKRAPDCMVGVTTSPSSNDEEQIPCEAILSGSADRQLQTIAKRYLIAAMKR